MGGLHTLFPENFFVINMKQYLSQLFSDVFLVSVTVYTGIAFAELFKKGVVSHYLNTTVLFVIIAASGAGVVLFTSDKKEKGAWASGFLSIFVGLYIAFLIYSQTKGLGNWSYLFALGALLVTTACGIFASHEWYSEQS